MLAAFAATPAVQAKTEVVTLPSKSPIVTFRFVFRAGSADDPAGKPGTAALTAAMLAEGGTKTRTYKQIVDAMFPMASHISRQVDKEMVTFAGETHVDNLEQYYSLFREMLLEPGWRQEDLSRLRDNMINFLRVSLRGNNDEELGKEVLYTRLYEGHSYGHHNAGTVSSLEKLTTDDLKQFYRAHFTRANLILGLAGGYPEGFVERVRKDFEKLPESGEALRKLPAPQPLTANRVTIIDKNTRSVAFSFGFTIEVTRGHPDYPALLVMQSYFGQHRNSGGRLYNRMREARGLNYGDYAYIEYFPRGMFLMEPPQNVARRQEIFQIWIRPVEPPNAHFALRLALYELDKLVSEGIPAEAFERTRKFLSKYVNLLIKTKSAELGYAIDSKVYGIPGYTSYVKNALAKLRREDVNRAIRKHLRAENIQLVVVTDKGEEFRKKLLANEPSPVSYNSPKPEEILAEDKLVMARRIALDPKNVEVVPVERVFE